MQPFNNMPNENKNITALCQQIEQTLGRPVRTPQDFEYLSQQILATTRQSLSVSTLKRLYGYVTTESSLRRSTLDILCQYLGHRDWGTFCRRDSQSGVESDPLLAESISADELCEDDIICVTWQPDRECHFRCTGHHEFIVETSQNSKLTKGDTFRCHLFVKGEPLYLEYLRMQGATPVHYVCGRDHGIDFSLI